MIIHPSLVIHNQSLYNHILSRLDRVVLVLMEVIILHNKTVGHHQFLVSLLLVVVMVVIMDLMVKMQILVDLVVDLVENVVL